MKKILIISFLISVIGMSVYAAEIVYNRVFITRMMQCLPTSNYVTSSVEGGMDVKVIREISHWKDHTCGYKETTIKNDETTVYVCNLDRDQVTAFVEAMKADPANIGKAKEVWQKYMKDKNVCQKQEQKN